MDMQIQEALWIPTNIIPKRLTPTHYNQTAKSQINRRSWKQQEKSDSLHTKELL